jgi:nucleotidyltransferase/DNA polymerase involved in DNA repair
MHPRLIMRIILHLDLDAFFAACEECENPALAGKPLVIGADPKQGKGRGVVSTASYEARKYGIRSGMPISTAWKLCPAAPLGPCIYLPVNFELYTKTSYAIFSIVRTYADAFEQAGIDESYLDVSKRCKSYEEAKALAGKIKSEIKEKEHLSCSIGIGPNKLIAKIASDFQKPNGLTVVLPDDVQEFLSPLSVRKLIGIGPKTEAFLKTKEITTISQLRKIPEFILIEWFGNSFGAYLYKASHGIDESPLVEHWTPKSFGREWTFEKDVKDGKLVFSTLEELAKAVAKTASQEKFEWQTITVKVRYAGFETHTSQKKLENFTQDIEVSLNVAKDLLNPYLKSKRLIRLIGFRISDLNPVQ